MLDLPTRFNDDLIKECKSLNKWFDMCPFVTNSGFGPRVVEDPRRVLSNNSWYGQVLEIIIYYIVLSCLCYRNIFFFVYRYVTNQFLLGVIFRARMRQYGCLTNDSSLASAVYIPFYAGLDVGRHLWGFNVTVRDSLARDLIELVRSRHEWTRMSGRDHFLVGGRTGSDYRRETDEDSDWGNKLMMLPESKNMTLLSIESTMYRNDFGVPYPTYFHPKKLVEVEQWQEHVRRQPRKHLVSFVGAPRPGSEDSIRSQLINQCVRAPHGKCNLLRCTYGHNKCEDPAEVIRVFTDSVFCLQPPGDSFTRRSTFDSILAGCIPVFFHPGSGYTQYAWHFPKDYSKFSVFIPEDDVHNRNVSVVRVLSRVSEAETQAMRTEVVRMIPRIVYADSSGDDRPDFEDAFDVAIKSVLDRIEGVRRRVSQGEDPSIGFSNSDLERFNLPNVN